MKQKECILISEKDNVAIALTKINQGEEVFVADINKKIKVLVDIEQGHKFAVKNIKTGEDIIKYANAIGEAICDIKEGELVHTHNIKTKLLDKIEYSYNFSKIDNTIKEKYEKDSETLPSYFYGYSRKINGKNMVGVRNDIWIIPTVGCVNKIAERIKCYVMSELKDELITNDGETINIISFSHPYGCSQMGEDQENTRNAISSLINHPNAGGVLVLGLGCENSGIDVLKKYIGNIDENRIKFLVSQKCEDEVEDALKLIKVLIKNLKQYKRERLNVSNLIVGLKCGGSDGLSGITANPCIGVFSDILIAKGGSTILTEVPEMFGAEHLLMNRCNNVNTFNRYVDLINEFKDYYKKHNQVIYDNPSPGNKSGGISTLEDKSLGCTQKSGNTNVTNILKYGELCEVSGLNILNAPGNDLVSSTALAISGAQIVLFSTGRGTPFSSPVPTLKISTNNNLNNNKNNWIDFNAGCIIENESVEECAKRLYRYFINVVNGEKLKSEKCMLYDMAIFKTGVTL